MKKILIVDDKLENRYMLESLLNKEDFETLSAENGVEALKVAHLTPPDLIISDILMPVMDGFTLCKEWRKDDLLQKIPFIFYTAAYTNPKDIKYALKLGADRFLIKPQEPIEFLNEIKEVLQEFESGKIEPRIEQEKNELDNLREYNSILFRKLEDKLYQIDLHERKLKRYSFELEETTKKLRNAEERLRQTHNLLENLAEDCNLAFISMDEDLIIHKLNRRFETLTGYSSREIIGKTLTLIVSQDVYLRVKNMSLNDKNEFIKIPVFLKNGKLKDTEWNFSSFINSEGEKVISAIVLKNDKDKTAIENPKNQNHLEQNIKIRTEELENSREQLRALSSHLQNIREEERKHVAREIHDELGHLLTALKLDMEGMINQKADSIEIFKEKLLPLITLVDAAIDSMKTIATELRPAILDNFGLIPALEWQIQQLRIRTNIECEYEFKISEYNFTNEVSTAIFRIFQEILTNISRHSKATNIWVVFAKDDSELVLKVKDNGIGFETDKVSGVHSFGLLGMKERALSIGGELTIESIKEIGTAVTLRIREKG